MKIIQLSRLARTDLRSIVRFTRKKWGVLQSQKYRAALQRAFVDLAFGTAKARSAQLSGRSDLLKLLVGKHYIFLQQDGTTLFVSRVLHSAMNFEEHKFPVLKGTRRNK